MKICSIRIKGFQQFQDLYLDFTHPETGEPLDKICFIGKNGTGKSTLLELINDFLKTPDRLRMILKDKGLIIVKIKHREMGFYCLVLSEQVTRYRKARFKDTFYSLKVEDIESWYDLPPSKISRFEIGSSKQHEVMNEMKLNDLSSDLLIHSPSESKSNGSLQIHGVPKSSLDKALQYFETFPCHHVVSDETIEDFWRLLIFLIKKRENERNVFENKEENLDKTKKELIREFEDLQPKILDKLSILWDKILEKAGLEFDVENANIPIQLNDNLKAYIKNKKTGEVVQYNQLSSGIRNFIFRVGHIYSLYFNREIKRGFLLVDEPENSLFPDFLFDLIETYQNLMVDKNGENNTQFFVATHSPIVAAQFEPYERIILDWVEDGSVVAMKGTTPIGDDPNDILVQDFNLRSLMGKAGQAKWEEYLGLKKKLRHSNDSEEKESLISAISKIGSAYNF